jgi:hypothetical protein
VKNKVIVSFVVLVLFASCPEPIDAPLFETDQLSAVTIDPPSRLITGATTITLSHERGSAEIYYTTDGSDPEVGVSTLYTDTFDVSTDTTVKAIAADSGFDNSTIAEGRYEIDPRKGILEIYNGSSWGEAFPSTSLASKSSTQLRSWYTLYLPDNYIADVPEITLYALQNCTVNLSLRAIIEVYTGGTLELSFRQSDSSGRFDSSHSFTTIATATDTADSNGNMDFTLSNSSIPLIAGRTYTIGLTGGSSPAVETDYEGSISLNL